MWEKIKYLFVNNKTAQLILFLLVILTIWWAVLNPFDPEGASENARFIWGASYQVITIIGGLLGIRTALAWGGARSTLGRSILCFSLGLLLQAFGQSVYSFYNLYQKIEAPYPSLGDVGFFGSIPFYIYGTILLAKVAGAKVSLRAFVNQIQAIVLPLILLGTSYAVFLRHYEFDWTKPLQVVLDFGYPLGQATYVALAILAFLLTRKVLGGIMRMPTLLLLTALVFQYLSDYNFLYQFSKETWYVGGYGDYMYLVSYFLMAISLLQLDAIYHQYNENSA